MPDLTVLLDVSPQTGRRRRSGRAADRMETEAEAFHERVRRHFLDLAEAAPERYLVLDASSAKADLASQIAGRVEAVLPAGVRP
ncbi:hypothetical protein GCM10025883_03920 [Mobilicoccus caccae]|uniref:Thymidylate kinase-like domain-containing protein n=1 Tax=Mobilicoccus caccae TaxID=1859295 RepID=A0ABQ6INN5_9MICO|nr:hypothetical protein GCM10025883_03920 [Mobilicoccus caccae]